MLKQNNHFNYFISSRSENINRQSGIKNDQMKIKPDDQWQDITIMHERIMLILPTVEWYFSLPPILHQTFAGAGTHGRSQPGFVDGMPLFYLEELQIKKLDDSGTAAALN